MKRTTQKLHNACGGVLRAVLMIPLTLSGCFDDKKTDPPPVESFDLAVSVTGSGSVSSSPAGIDCGNDCVETLTSGSTITLNATPASGSMLTGWGGDCSGSTPSCTLTMSASRAVTASFTFTTDPPPAAQYILSVNVTGSGSVTSSPAGIDCGSDCTETLTAGSSLTLSATPASGFMFSGWSGDCSGTASCAPALNANRTVTATFTATSPPAAQYSLSVNVTGSGSVSSNPAGISCGTDCTENYADGSNVTLTVTANPASTFAGWSGACSGTQTTCTVSMSVARSVSASFMPVQRALSVTINGSGSVTSAPTGINCGVDCSENYAHGSNVTLTPSPGANQQFSGWLGACSGTTTCTVAMTDARSVTATFAPIPIAQFTLTVSVTGRGSVASSPAGISCGGDCSESYASGQSVTLTATAENGFQFSSWGGACSGSNACAVAMSQARSVTANFSQDSASLTVGYNDTTATVTAATVVLDLAQPSLGNYPVWVSGVGFPGLIRAATHQVLPGGYFGRGFSRFTPGDFNDGGRGEHYCGIGQIHGFSTVGDSSRMVVGQLIRYGTSFFTDQAIKRPPDGSIKQLILIKDVGGSGSRPMLVTKGENTPSGTKVLAACDGTVCNTTNDINNIDYFNEGNHQPDLNDYLGQWLWVEFAVNTNIPFIRVRTWSANGVLSGAETIAPWGAGGRVTDLDVISFVNGIVTLGPQPYFDLERIEFRVGSDSNITPPAGFPGSAR